MLANYFSFAVALVFVPIQNHDSLPTLLPFLCVEEPTPKYTKEMCQNIASHLLHPTHLPDQCKKYSDVVTYLKRHDTDTAHPTQWMS